MNSADQSLQLISLAFAELVMMASTDRFRSHVTEAIISALTSKSDLDKWFLRGDAADIGVVPLKSTGDVLHGAIVARALWDTHWREEWCEINPSKLDFYAPLTNKPVFSLCK